MEVLKCSETLRKALISQCQSPPLVYPTTVPVSVCVSPRPSISVTCHRYIFHMVTKG